MFICFSKKYRLLIFYFFIHLIFFLWIFFLLICSCLIININSVCRHPSAHHCFHIQLHFIVSARALWSWLLLNGLKLVKHWIWILVLSTWIFRNKFVYLLSLNLKLIFIFLQILLILILFTNNECVSLVFFSRFLIFMNLWRIQK
jgi:hypothetical protein